MTVAIGVVLCVVALVVGAFADYDFASLKGNLSVPGFDMVGREKMSSAWSVGGRMPLNCGAGPRVLMAHRPAEALARVLARPLEAMTPYTPAEPLVLAAALARIRERGWELGVNDVVEGISSVGIPVRDRGGTVIAAISISGLHVHILAGDQPRHLATLQRRVHELELRLT